MNENKNFFNFSFQWLKKYEGNNSKNEEMKEIELKEEKEKEELEIKEEEQSKIEEQQLKVEEEQSKIEEQQLKVEEQQSKIEEQQIEMKGEIKQHNSNDENIDVTNEEKHKYLIKRIKLTKNNFIAIIISTFFIILSWLCWLFLFKKNDNVLTSFLIMVISSTTILCFSFIWWIKQSSKIEKIIKETFIPLYTTMKESIKSIYVDHPTAMYYFCVSNITTTTIISISFLTTQYKYIYYEKNVFYSFVMAVFDLVGYGSIIVLSYFIFILIISLFINNILKRAQFHFNFFPFVPSFVASFIISIASYSSLKLFFIVFFAVLSMSTFISFILLIPLLFFTDNENPIDKKTLLSIFPIIICVLICVLLTWILLFIPGNSDDLPTVQVTQKSELDREDGIILGGYNKIIKHYSSTSDSDYITTTVDLSPIITIKGVDTTKVDVTGNIYVPISSQPKDLIVFLHSETVSSKELSGYDYIPTFFVSHNIITMMVDMTSLKCDTNKLATPVRILSLSSANLLARSYLLLHHIKLAEDIFDNVTNIHLVGHGIGANVISLACRIFKQKTLPGFPLIPLPEINHNITSLSVISPTSDYHYQMTNELSGVSSLFIETLSTPLFSKEMILDKHITNTENTIQTKLYIYGGYCNGFNKLLPNLDAVDKKWEYNTKSLLSKETHQLILKNTLASFIFSQTNKLYISRLLNYKNNGLGNHFYVNTFLNSSKSLFDFNLPFNEQNYNVTVQTDSFYYHDITTGVSHLHCSKKSDSCFFNITYDEYITPSKGVYVDLTTDYSKEIMLTFGNYAFTTELDVALSVKINKFQKTFLPLDRLLQTYFYNVTEFNYIQFNFNSTLLVSNLYYE